MIVIFGAGGYLGSALHKHLNESEIAALGVVRKGTKLLNLDTSGFLDFEFDQSNWTLDVPSQAHTAINFIGPTARSFSDNPTLVENEIKHTTKRLVSSLNNSSIKRVINISTIHIYSQRLDSEYREDSPKTNPSPYAKGHVKKEELFRTRLNNDIQLINLRLGNAFGEPGYFHGDFNNLFVNQLVKSAVLLKPVKIRSNRFTKRNFLCKTDLCRVLKMIALENRLDYRGPLNFGGQDMSLEEMALYVKETLSDVANLRSNFLFSDQASDDRFDKFCFNCDLAASLDLKAKNDFKSEIRSLYEYYSAHKDV